MDRMLKTGIGVVICVVFIAAAVGILDVSTSGVSRPHTAAVPSKPATVTIGFIGDSITDGPDDGAKTAVDTEVGLLGSNYKAVNRGVDGSTTGDWQPGKKLYDEALAEFKEKHVTVVSIMLGTNDANLRDKTSPEDYEKNMRAIVNGLLQTGTVTRVVVNYPPYVAPDVAGRKRDRADPLLEAYMMKIDALAGIPGVSIGDTTAYDYFRDHQNLLADGVHPTKEGYVQLGKLWAQGYEKVLAASQQ